MQLELIICFCMMTIPVSFVASVTVDAVVGYFQCLQGATDQCVGGVQVPGFDPT
mgnify:CR=1 FL=1